MRINIDETGAAIYAQVAERIARDIADGTLPPGTKLPTVRRLAAETGISQGTVKHAYDTLEREGLIRKTRGSGSFVSAGDTAEPQSAKKRALAAIDALLDTMKELGFTRKDTRIFLDLKLRENEERGRKVTVAAVDCSPEALSVMYHQILELPHTDVYKYNLDDALSAPKRFDPAADIVVTTATHFEELARKMPPGRRPARLVMSIATKTALELAALPPSDRLGVVSASPRFGQVMLAACEEYCKLKTPAKLAYFGDEAAVSALAEEHDRLLLPPNYALFASNREAAIIKAREKDLRPIKYRYRVERGSLLHLEEQIEKIHRTRGG
jgi:DNA-binding transcriptional regulator YhcF (GntR family)